MPRKNKPQNPLSFRANADPGAKCKKQKKEREMRTKSRKIPCYMLFVFRDHFRVFHNKCIAGLTKRCNKLASGSNGVVGEGHCVEWWKLAFSTSTLTTLPLWLDGMVGQGHCVMMTGEGCCAERNCISFGVWIFSMFGLCHVEWGKPPFPTRCFT